jgi:hypothetical protein
MAKAEHNPIAVVRQFFRTQAMMSFMWLRPFYGRRRAMPM